jgi:hypothetical protein
MIVCQSNFSTMPIGPMRMLKELFLMVLILSFLNGCTTMGRPEAGTEAEALSRGNAQTVRLEKDLATLLGYRDDETLRLAQTILTTTEALARQYHVQPPALWHNFLVNVGMRDRGLCCHWTQDLLREIDALQLQKYHAVWAVSRHGSWREHSSVVITATGQGFNNGLVLDAWRNAGNLYWTLVAEDIYVWQRHPGENGVARIRCR